MELHQLVYWLGFCVLSAGIAVLLRRRYEVDGEETGWLGWLASRAIERLQSEPEPDPVAERLYQAVRRERLRADLQRLQRILATDSWMSATRQLGNRLAYDQLLTELERLRTLLPAVLPGFAPTDWSTAAPAPAAAGQSVLGVGGAPRPAGVEVLDIGWRT